MERIDQVEGARGERWRAPSLPTDATGFSTSAVIVAILAIVSTWWVVHAVQSVMAANQFESALVDLVLYAFGALSIALLVPAILSVNASMHARQAIAAGDIVAARVQGASARTWCWYTCGYGAAIGIVLAPGAVHHRQQRLGRPDLLPPAADRSRRSASCSRPSAPTCSSSAWPKSWS